MSRRVSRSKKRTVQRIGGTATNRAAASPMADEIAVEEPLEIRIGGRPFVVTMRTPGEDPSLAAGFLAAEGLVRSPEEILRIAPCTNTTENARGNVLDVALSGEAPFRWSRAKRQLLVSSACGLCGKERIDQVRTQLPPEPPNELRVSPDVLLSLPDRLRRRQRVFSRTGGLHAAAIFDLSGRLRAMAEDVGRHNAVDKVLGHLFLKGRWPLQDSLLCVSGRASFEITQKAAMAGVRALVSVSAPSTLAIDLAREAGMTLVGFVRDGGANVYSRPERLEVTRSKSARRQRLTGDRSAVTAHGLFNPNG